MGITITVILGLMLAYFLIDIMATVFAGVCIFCRYIKSRYQLTHN